MFETNFYPDLINVYFDNIKPPKHHEELAKIGGPITQYLADQNNNIINLVGNNTSHIIDIDISSAFPTICYNLFDPNNNFIQLLNTIQDKKAKNIHIATTLKGEPLKQLNRICKIIILGIIFDTDNQQELEDILILELKKDGCILNCPSETLNRLNNLNSTNKKFTQFVLSHNFNFHFDEYSKYVRANRTTFLLNKTLDNLTVKGYYKHVPKKLKQIMINCLKTNTNNFKEMNIIYNRKYFKILQKNNLKSLLSDYYLCDNNKVIDQTSKYVPLHYSTKVNPELYKSIFIHPLLIQT